VSWVGKACRRGIAWLWNRIWPPRLAVPLDALAGEEAQLLTTGPGARIVTQLRIRRETPPGIARLAAILDEWIRESAISSDGGLAGRPAGGG